MATQNAFIFRMNGGLQGKRLLARTDLDKTGFSAEVMTNWIAHTQGDMQFRPGTEYICATLDNDYAALIPFVKSTDDTAIVEVTSDGIQVLIDDEKLSRPRVTGSIRNGGFDGNLSSWNDLDEVNSSSIWVAGGYMGLTGSRYSAAIREQEVQVNNRNIEHAVRLTIARGNVMVSIGSTAGGGEYFPQAELGKGTHSIAFTPSTGSFYVRISNREQSQSLVESVELEAAGAVTLPTMWSDEQLSLLRHDQSGDVIFIACDGARVYKMERRNNRRTWSIVEYESVDGAFLPQNTTGITLSPDVLNGNIGLSASAPLFNFGHLGALFKITSLGQSTSNNFTGSGQYGDYIKVTGVGTSRTFTVTTSGMWSATVTLQRAFSEPNIWTDTGTVYSTNGTFSVSDGLDNQIVYYRLGVNIGGYTSGTVSADLGYGSGSNTGIVRITNIVNSQLAGASVLKPLGGTAASEVWSESAWSDYRGYPTALVFYEGRLWFAGRDKIWGSVSDNYYSFDEDVEGDSAPIIRNLGVGAADVVNWLLPLNRLIIGLTGSEREARSSSLDEPLTPTNFNIKSQSTQGSAPISAAQMDGLGVFIQRGGRRAFVLDVGNNGINSGYVSSDLTLIVPEVGEQGLLSVAVQRQPDPRFHFVRGDGKVAILAYNPAENLMCWFMYETDGFVENVVVMPGVSDGAEDRVYYLVRRTVGGQIVRYIERWALESEARGGIVNKMSDSHYIYNGVANSVITGLQHLEGLTVNVWGNSKSLGEYVVNGGQITLSESVTYAVIGLPYSGLWKSTKLAYASQLGTAIAQRKRVSRLALVLSDTHARGLQYGADFSRMYNMPQVERGVNVDQNSVWESYDADSFYFPDSWDTDSRICLKAQSPLPASVLGIVASIQTNERV